MSMYQKLLREENSLPIMEKDGPKISMDQLMNIFVKPRAELKTKIIEAFQNNEITKSQYDELIDLNLKHALPQ